MPLLPSEFQLMVDIDEQISLQVSPSEIQMEVQNNLQISSALLPTVQGEKPKTWLPLFKT